MESTRLFAILLSEESTNKEEVLKKLKKNYPRHFRYTDSVFLAAIDSKVQTGEIAKSIGLYGPGHPEAIQGASGVIMKLNKGYAGYTDEDLWEWLDKQKEVERT